MWINIEHDLRVGARQRHRHNFCDPVIQKGGWPHTKAKSFRNIQYHKQKTIQTRSIQSIIVYITIYKNRFHNHIELYLFSTAVKGYV